MPADETDLGTFQGVPPSHERPGTFEHTRTITGDYSAAWTKFDFRSSAWLQKCPQLNGGQRAIVDSNAVLRRVDIRIVGPGTGDYVRVAEEESPADRWKSADEDALVVRKDFAPYHQRSILWLKTSGSVTLEFSIHFDLAVPQGQVP